MQLGYRNTQKSEITVTGGQFNRQGDLLIHDIPEARRTIEQLESQLKTVKNRARRAELLLVRATLYQSIGVPEMLQAAQECYAECKGAEACLLMGVALHHHGRMKEAYFYYERAFRQPHPVGFEFEVNYASALLYQGRWAEAWPYIHGLRKRMVVALRLPQWRGEDVPEVQIVPEGGFGDVIQYCRWLPEFQRRGIKTRVFLPAFSYANGFAEYLAKQPWFPPISGDITEIRRIPSIGFFDFCPTFKVTPETIPDYPSPFVAQNPLKRGDSCKPVVGLCWSAQQTEAPLCEAGSYRSLTLEQARHLVNETSAYVQWVNLKYGVPLEGTIDPEMRSWDDTANIVAGLDAVVSVDTSVMHLAAAMGKPTWTLLSGASEWKFGTPELTGNRCLWYPTMRLFRNNAFGFDNAVNSLIAAIKQGDPWQTAPSLSER